MKRFALVVSVACLAAVAVSQDPNPGLKKLIGKPLPKVAMKTTTGKRFTNANLKGKVVLFDFWATYCGPCKIAEVAIQKLHTNYASKGLVAIGSSTYEYGAAPVAAKYQKKHGYTYNFTEKNDAFAHSLGIKGVPVFILVDKKGIVRNAWAAIPPGGADQLYATIEAEIQPLLAAK